MATEKTALTDRRGFENILLSPDKYQQSCGIHLNGIFKPFRSKFDSSGWPHFHLPIVNLFNPSGTFGATASGLTPWGNNTLNEGIISGSGIPFDVNLQLDATDVRALGLKSPLILVGPGYDNFGYPVPNYSSGWAVSGAFGNFSPSSGFTGAGTGFVTHLRDTPYSKWATGPLDLRYDILRGVWGFSCGVQFARIINASLIDNPTGIMTDPQFSEKIRYGAMVWDGIANQMVITGCLHVGPRPKVGTYKVLPYSSGDYTFIVNIQDSGGIPRYGLWMVELPGVEDCGSSGTVGNGGGEQRGLYAGSPDGSPWDSTGVLTGSGLFDGLQAFPMSFAYGGLGFNSIAPGQVVIGNASGNIIAGQISAGTGITLQTTATGIIVKFASGVDFNTAGVNTTITELQGLSTPLSVAQGGTGSAVKNFVDLSTGQTVSGFKQFGNGLRVKSGTASAQGISFIEQPTAGIFYSSGIGVGISDSGVVHALFTVSGTSFQQNVTIYASSNSPGLVIRQNAFSTKNIFEVQDVSASGIFGITPSGSIFIGQSGARTHLNPATGLTTNTILTLPSTGYISNKSYVNNILTFHETPSGTSDGSNGLFYLSAIPVSGKVMLFKAGLLQRPGSGYDYTLSSSGIMFSSGNYPANNSTDWIAAFYQGLADDRGAIVVNWISGFASVAQPTGGF